MLTGLAITAIAIFLLYSVYFFHIIRSQAEHFEKMMLTNLADWMIAHKQTARKQLNSMLFLSFLLEAVYFILVFLVIRNPVFLIITGAFALFEAFHLARLTIKAYQFFKGRSPLKDLFNWKIERTSAWLFFTHALLVLIQLLVWYTP